jgi:hypothetical protein
MVTYPVAVGQLSGFNNPDDYIGEALLCDWYQEKGKLKQ